MNHELEDLEDAVMLGEGVDDALGDLVLQNYATGCAFRDCDLYLVVLACGNYYE